MDVDEFSVLVNVNSCCDWQVHYKKGHHERKAKYTSLPDPPEMELAKKVSQQRSDVSNNFKPNKNHYDWGRYTDEFFLSLSYKYT